MTTRVRLTVSKRHPTHHGRNFPGVTLVHVVANTRTHGLGGAVGEVGTAYDLVHWKMETNEGGWAAPEWEILDDVVSGRKIGYFSGVEVESEARGQGVGRKLASRLVREMQKAGAVVQWLAVAPMDEETEYEGLVRLYQSLGFTEMAGGDEGHLWRVER